MASTKDLKKRIASVKNTQQTTKAMKMVSAAKLRRGQEAIQNHRPYARRIAELIQALTSAMAKEEFEEKYPLIFRRHDSSSEKKKVLLVLVTSDRGLCGGFNSAAIKALQRLIGSYRQMADVELQLAFVGRKGHDFFKKRDHKILKAYSEASGTVTFAKAKKVADDLISLFLTGEVDEIKFVFNEFKNALTQKVVIENFLPLQSSIPEQPGAQGDPNGLSSDQTNEKKTQDAGPLELSDYIVKPNKEAVLQSLLSRNFAIQSFRILLESQAGEHGARMSAMENATKNAGEMIQKLTLQYNKQRQAGITKELLEIIAGSESQKG